MKDRWFHFLDINVNDHFYLYDWVNDLNNIYSIKIKKNTYFVLIRHQSDYRLIPKNEQNESDYRLIPRNEQNYKLLFLKSIAVDHHLYTTTYIYIDTYMYLVQLVCLYFCTFLIPF